MAKIKLNLRVRSSVGFLLCCVVLMAASSDESNNSNPADAKLALVLQRLEAVETRNLELEKKVEELNKRVELIESGPEKKCDEEIEPLKKKLEELENRIVSDHGLSLLMSPLRGPPGKKGDPGLGSLKNKTQSLFYYPFVNNQLQGRHGHFSFSPFSKTINSTNKSVQALCDFEVNGGGWTLIQKRSFGSREEFYRNWNDYANGFGLLDGNFWMGLENIHVLTKNGDQELRIELEDFEGNKAFAKYSSFSISDASDFYKLEISGFYGNSTAGDSMINRHNQMKFSTKDKDDDNWGRNCAEYYSSGWWFNNCISANLNGLYRNKGDHQTRDEKGISWYTWKKTLSYSLAKTEMKIRKRK